MLSKINRVHMKYIITSKYITLFYEELNAGKLGSQPTEYKLKTSLN